MSSSTQQDTDEFARDITSCLLPKKGKLLDWKVYLSSANCIYDLNGHILQSDVQQIDDKHRINVTLTMQAHASVSIDGRYVKVMPYVGSYIFLEIGRNAKLTVRIPTFAEQGMPSEHFNEIVLDYCK
jgi:hypothetical protein